MHFSGSGRGEKQVSVVLFSTTAKTVLTYRDSQKGKCMKAELVSVKE